jgi:hypothetical protein
MPEQLLRSDGEEVSEARTAGNEETTSDEGIETERTLDDIIETYARE